MSASLRIAIFPAVLHETIAFSSALGVAVTGRGAGPPPYAPLSFDAVHIGACEARIVDPSLRAISFGTEAGSRWTTSAQCYDKAVGASVEPTDQVARGWSGTRTAAVPPR